MLITEKTYTYEMQISMIYCFKNVACKLGCVYYVTKIVRFCNVITPRHTAAKSLTKHLNQYLQKYVTGFFIVYKFWLNHQCIANCVNLSFNQQLTKQYILRIFF